MRMFVSGVDRDLWGTKIRVGDISLAFCQGPGEGLSTCERRDCVNTLLSSMTYKSIGKSSSSLRAPTPQKEPSQALSFSIICTHTLQSW